MYMEKPVLLTISIAALFLFAKLIEMKLGKEVKPVKFIIRDTFIVFGCAFVPVFLFFQSSGSIADMLGAGDVSVAPTQIFTDMPGF